MTARDGGMGARSRWGAWAALLATLVFANAGNMLLDGVAKAHGLSPSLLLDPRLALALGCLGLGFFWYVKALAWLPLAVAYPVLVGISILGLTTIAVLGGCATPSWSQAVGIVLVFFGIALISRAARGESAA